MRGTRLVLTFGTVLALGVFGVTGTSAAARRHESGRGVPSLDVKQSCSDAQKFATGDDRNSAYKGCMQDETRARDELAKRWSSFKSRDRENCVAQSRDPSPSYVEVLTCLEMDSDAMAIAPKVDGRPVPQIGGSVAPGLTGAPATSH